MNGGSDDERKKGWQASKRYKSNASASEDERTRARHDGDDEDDDDDDGGVKVECREDRIKTR